MNTYMHNEDTMDNVLHKTGRVLNVDNIFTLRNEENGITIHKRAEHLFLFYEGVFIENLEEDICRSGADAVRRFMVGNEYLLSKNVQSDNPFVICWMISGTCNLDCIYCFAENKMFETRRKGRTADACERALCDEMETAEHLLSLNPLCIGLTGGEPTLSPKLGDVLRFFKGKVSTILDTNGTTPQLKKLIPVLKDTNTTVRLTVDILNDEILCKVRPSSGQRCSSGSGITDVLSSFSQSGILADNIKALIDADVPLVIHSVLTGYNIGRLDDTAERLIQLGVKRWHFYPVNYSEKCRTVFEEIKVSRQEACEYADSLAARYGDKLTITCPRNEVGFRECSVLVVDSYGRFCVDTIKHGCVFLGNDSTHPTKKEILSKLDIELHKQGYLYNFWQA